MSTTIKPNAEPQLTAVGLGMARTEEIRRYIRDNSVAAPAQNRAIPSPARRKLNPVTR